MDNEDYIEARLAFFIALLGGSMYEEYLNRRMKMVQTMNLNEDVDHMTKTKILNRTNGNPTIFYGDIDPYMHFTCSIDGQKIWNSYPRIQKQDSNHFCQTFTLMKMQSVMRPKSYLANLFHQLLEQIPKKKKEKEIYMHNVLLARDAAVHVMEFLLKKLSKKRIMQLIQEELFVAAAAAAAVGRRKRTFPEMRHEIDSYYVDQLKTNLQDEDVYYDLLETLTIYVKNLTKEDLLSSTFSKNIF